ncbi:hypothetical protein DRN75_03110 [Nanoarchaeota archaeon]|nr:MAG: hypothetical protein DRN75_03110 [Nanoarchaeota archaeon]
MAAKRVKKKEHENLTDVNIIRVIELLEAKPPITKKTACEILNIAYNTTRLNNIVEGFKEQKATQKRLRDANRGKPLSIDEKSNIIESYLKGESLVDISKSIYRSVALVRSVIASLGVPKRATGDEKRFPLFLPDNCVSEDFEPGQKAWSAVYHAPCEVLKEVSGELYQDKYGCKCYQIYVIEPLEEALDMYPNIKVGGFSAYSTAYNLGSLEHLLEYGIKLDF